MYFPRVCSPVPLIVEQTNGIIIINILTLIYARDEDKSTLFTLIYIFMYVVSTPTHGAIVGFHAFLPRRELDIESVLSTRYWCDVKNSNLIFVFYTTTQCVFTGL